MASVSPCLIQSRDASGEPQVRLGVPLLDEYLEFLSGRCRPNTVLAVAYDLKVFFTVVGKTPKGVRPGDVLAFMTAQRTGRGSIAETVQPVDGERVGVSTRTLRRRLSSVSGLYAFLHARGDVTTNAVPRGLPTRRERQRPGQGVPLVRGTRNLLRVLTPAEVDALTAALRTHRDRAMVAAMVLGGLRRCEVVVLRLGDLRVAERRVFIADGKGGHQRLVPISARFFEHLAAYLDTERPADADTDHVFALGPKMARLRREHHRPLGNGYCTRPPELDCAFESICETCTFFQTSIELRPTLQAQHHDAAAKGQDHRAQLFDDLLNNLDDSEAS